MAHDPTNARGPDAVTHQLPAGELPAGWSLLEGQYEITRLIASGGFGITYLARDTLGRDVAVKECFPLGLAQRTAATHTVSAASAGTLEHFETARAQFLREARMLAALRHPNVVHVQTLFEENGTAYMAMDFIHGRDLQEEIVAGSVPAPRVLDLARDLLGALEYVHAQSILHRDIKPQNIRIDRFGVPMLIDFGAARAETQARSRMAGTFRVVTDGYSPHEFYVAGALQGPHSDLYALAATLYHVITGAAPAPADERASALSTGQDDPYVPIANAYPTHDGRLLHLIDRALRMTPKDRPETASVWLAGLADAPTTLIAPAVVTAAKRNRLIPGVLAGVLLMGAAGAAIWTVQPPWLAPAMGEMSARMDLLEQSLEEAEVARAMALMDLSTLQDTLLQAEAELFRLEDASGDMTATMAQLNSVQAARDAAATQIAGLEAELEALATMQAALEQAATDRDAALARADALAADGTELASEIATLQASLSEASRALVEARAEATTLQEVNADLTAAEVALARANARAGTLEQELQQARTSGTDLNALRREVQGLTAALSTSEAERARLATEIDAMPDTADVDVFQTRITTLEADTAELTAALAVAQDALAARRPPYTQTYALRAPSGTFALLPRFSWDNRHIAAVDSAGGIALYDRETGAYRAHLARGIPDDITRLGFSSGGAYLIATTPRGTPNRLYDIAAQREIMRFEPETVTTADRAISSDEQWLVYARSVPSGRVEVVRLSLPDMAAGIDSETVLTSAANATNLRVSFAETRNELYVVTGNRVEVYSTDGDLLETAVNRMGQVAALSPIGRDDGILILRRNGDVVIFDDIIAQTETAQIAARATYSRYRLSGNRLNFLRANGDSWDVINLLTGEVRGSGVLRDGYEDAYLALSADGAMIFIGAAGALPARIISVTDGADIQQFDGATEGYFSFDNQYLTTGTTAESTALIWRLNDAYRRNLMPDR